MIVGVVNDEREAIVRLRVRGENGTEIEIEAVIDTGFTGFLTLPREVIESLALVWRGRAHGQLGDGSIRPFDVYAATVLWEGRERIVETDAAECAPLVGMALIYGHELLIQVVEGGGVTIDALDGG